MGEPSWGDHMVRCAKIDRVLTGSSDASCLVFTFFDVRFSITIIPTRRRKNPVETLFITAMDHIARPHPAPSDFSAFQSLLVDSVLLPGQKYFLDAAVAVWQERMSSNRLTTMHHAIFPETYYFALQRGPDFAAKITPIDKSKAYEDLDRPMPPTAENDFFLHDDMPIWTTRDLIVVRDMGLTGGIRSCKVALGSDTAICRGNGEAPGGRWDLAMRREIRCLRTVLELRRRMPGIEVNIPKLLGYLVHADHDNMIGYVCEDIQGWPLAEANREAFSLEMRRTWAMEVTNAVLLLHTLGLTWGGDGNPKNIIIDTTSQAWITGFSGVRMEGYYEKELEHSKVVDREGLRKLFRFLSASIPESLLYLPSGRGALDVTADPVWSLPWSHTSS